MGRSQLDSSANFAFPECALGVNSNDLLGSPLALFYYDLLADCCFHILQIFFWFLHHLPLHLAPMGCRYQTAYFASRRSHRAKRPFKPA